MKKSILVCSLVLALIISACTTTSPTTASDPTLKPTSNTQPTTIPTFTSRPPLLQPTAGQTGNPTPRPTRIRPTFTPASQANQPVQPPGSAQGDGRALTFIDPADSGGDAGMCDETQGFCNGAVSGLVIPVGYRFYTQDPVMPLMEISPDGTLIRIMEASLFLTEMSGGTQDPYTKLILQAGYIWIMLEKGTLEVETDIGVARVTDGCMSVFFDTQRIEMSISCLTGECVLENHSGSITLTDEEGADILAPETLPEGPRSMTKDESLYWSRYNPEAGD